MFHVEPPVRSTTDLSRPARCNPPTGSTWNVDHAGLLETRWDSEQRTAGRHADATREPIWNIANHVETTNGPTSTSDQRTGHDRHLAQRGGGPTIRVGIGGLADEQAASRSTQEAESALQRRSRGSEGPCRHDVVSPTMRRITGDLLGTAPDDLDPIDDRQLGHCSSQEGRPALRRVQQHQLQVGSGHPEHQAGDAATGPQVEDSTATLTDGLQEGRRVVDVDRDRARTEEAEIS